MKISLDAFLRSGNLGELRLGISKEEVQGLLGEPDAVGGGSRKYPQPSLFLYGAVELNFEQRHSQNLASIWWEAGAKGAFRLSPACEIVDWAFAPEWTFTRVDNYIDALGLRREYPDVSASHSTLPTLIVLESGVRISFEDGKLSGTWR